MSGLFNYMLLSKGGWSVDLLTINDFIKGLVYSAGLTAVLKMKWKKGIFHKVYVTGQVFGAIGLSCYTMYFFLDFLPTSFIFAMRIFVTMMDGVGFDLLYIPMFGRISKHLPEGFESTGITLFLSFMNTIFSISNYVTTRQLKGWKVHKGYYDRAKTPYLVNLSTNVILLFFSPLFLMWG